MLVNQILSMKPSGDIITVAPSVTVADAIRLLSEKRIGAVVVSEDGKTPLYAITEYANGDTGRINYRPDFTASEILRYFSLSLTNGEKVLRTRFVIGADGEPQIANSRIHQNILIVDRLFGAAELRLGSGERQQTVRIVRTDGRPAS